MFRGSVKSTGYPLHSPVSPPLPHPYVTVCHHISTGVYHIFLAEQPTTCTPSGDQDSFVYQLNCCEGIHVEDNNNNNNNNNNVWNTSVTTGRIILALRPANTA